MTTRYHIKAHAYHQCGYCDQRISITVDEDIDCTEDDIDEVSTQITDAIAGQKEADGWGYNGAYCPDCMTTHGREIAAMETADDYEMGGDR